MKVDGSAKELSGRPGSDMSSRPHWLMSTAAPPQDAHGPGIRRVSRAPGAWCPTSPSFRAAVSRHAIILPIRRHGRRRHLPPVLQLERAGLATSRG